MLFDVSVDRSREDIVSVVPPCKALIEVAGEAQSAAADILQAAEQDRTQAGELARIRVVTAVNAREERCAAPRRRTVYDPVGGSGRLEPPSEVAATTASRSATSVPREISPPPPSDRP